MLDEILKKRNLKYEDLTPHERETYAELAKSLNIAQITPDKLRDYISGMRASVEGELVDEPEYLFIFFPNRRNILLKARLKNYLLFEAFLLSPERAKKMIERTLG